MPPPAPIEPPVHRCSCYARLAQLAALLLVAAASSLPAKATTLTVPDQSPTIQAALDTWVDTVFVIPGTYPETPIVRRPVSLLGVSDRAEDYPVLGGLAIR